MKYHQVFYKSLSFLKKMQFTGQCCSLFQRFSIFWNNWNKFEDWSEMGLLFYDGGHYHIETSPLICFVNQ